MKGRPPPVAVPLPKETPPVDTGDFEAFSISEQGKNFSVDLKDLKLVRELGSGVGGAVSLVRHVPSGKMLAKKTMFRSDEDVRVQVVKELKALYDCQDDHIVQFYGAFNTEGSVEIVMEYMDAGTLLDIEAMGVVIPEPVIARVAEQSLKGLAYLHHKRHIIHRDIKPSNILINTKGEIKLADFGVSGQLTNTHASANSWVGTVTYMSPERIQGDSHYHIDSDIWSLGLTLVELILGRFPYPPGGQDRNKPLEFFTLLSYIVEHPPPALNPEFYSADLCHFIAQMLKTDPAERACATDLLEHPFLIRHSEKVDISPWIIQLKEMGLGSEAVTEQLTQQLPTVQLP
eukprot:TRINITY_DN40650_c0_g1_i1.p1 TRINITY_DN40650_c0_g1~~TRINITY_DN40650_c0_g1_i1.p1  ORF type:complete len:345 (+),score=58.74 TRINITY_DN40650_c0_g1_i1:68-1102(+)